MVKNAKHKGGFTLGEMIVVLSILGFLAGLIFPPLQQAVQIYRAESVVRQMMADIKMLQQKSLAETSANYKMDIYGNLVGNYYVLRDLQTQKTIKKVFLPSSMHFDDQLDNKSMLILSFGASGSIHNKVGLTIRIHQNNPQKTYGIVISGVVSRVRFTQIS